MTIDTASFLLLCILSIITILQIKLVPQLLVLTTGLSTLAVITTVCTTSANSVVIIAMFAADPHTITTAIDFVVFFLTVITTYQLKSFVFNGDFWDTQIKSESEIVGVITMITTLASIIAIVVSFVLGIV